jgi:aldehyde dehydrogenase (NAD+)
MSIASTILLFLIAFFYNLQSISQPSSPEKFFIMTYETRLFINNEYVNSSSGKTLSAYNPTDGSLLTDQVQAASSEDVDKAVAAAAAAFKTWKNTTTRQRASIMLKYADLVEKNADKLAQLETLNMGVPITVSRIFVGAQVDTFRYYAGLVDKVHGETHNEDGDGMLKMTVYEPLGVCAGISAWNATASSMGWKIAPAVAMGNTFVHKSSEKDTLGTIFLGSLFKEAGFPPGVVNLLSGAGDVGAALASHMDIVKISFTGSIGAGRKVQIAAAQSNLKHVTLELGGKSAAIVFEDADIGNAVQHNSQSFLTSNAQICSATSRLFVQESIAPAFIESLKQAWTQVSGTIGNPSDDNTFLGPLADKLHAQSVTNFIERAKAEGVEVLLGGEKREGPGAFVTPTLFLNPDLNSRIYREEVFGPVMVVRTFKTEDEVVELANDSPYGLAGAIYSSSIARALKVASRLEVGTLSINTAPFPHKQTPWGGYKQSGYGRENGLAGLMEYVQQKAIHISLKV